MIDRDTIVAQLDELYARIDELTQQLVAKQAEINATAARERNALEREFTQIKAHRSAFEEGFKAGHQHARPIALRALRAADIAARDRCYESLLRREFAG